MIVVHTQCPNLPVLSTADITALQFAELDKIAQVYHDTSSDHRFIHFLPKRYSYTKTFTRFPVSDCPLPHDCLEQ